MIKKINASKNKAFDKHEQVFQFEDKKVGLKGFIALHNTKLGSATGGTRLYPYKSEKDALTDVLRLSKAMTYKCAISGVPFGGGKAVIIANQKQKNRTFLRSYARIIDSFSGKYTTGTDVGMSDMDVSFMSKCTPFILEGHDKGRTTSEIASLGVYIALWAAIPLVFKKKKKSEISVAIKGLGKIGSELVRLLYKDGVKLYVADTNKTKVSKIRRSYPKVNIVNSKIIHTLSVDVYMPCALGNEFTDKNIDTLKTKLIVGGANNQLVKDSLAEKLHLKNIWYIPDYVVNAGGLIHIVDALDKKGYNEKRVDTRIESIGVTVKKLVTSSLKEGLCPLTIADMLVEKKIYEKTKQKQR